MNYMKSSADELLTLVTYIFDDELKYMYSYNFLCSISKLDVNEVKNIVKILSKYNIVLVKRRIGIFKNNDIINRLKGIEFLVEETENYVYIISDFVRFKIDKFEYNLVDYFNWKKMDSVKLITLIILLINFHNTYQIGIFVNSDNKIIYKERLIRCSDDYLLLEMELNDNNIVTYK